MAFILIIEDDKGINELIKRTLKMTGHNCLQAYTGKEAISIINKNAIDLVLLDINLPDINGFFFIRQIKDIPVIFVTAKDEIKDRVKGLNLGAVDYIIKPFDMEELVARVHAVLRRNQKQQDVYFIGDVKVDLSEYQVYKNGSLIDLTNREIVLLKVLIINRNIALSRSKLLDLAWGMEYEGEERTVDVHVLRLRKKLGLQDYIKTVFKYGYRLEF